MRATLLTCIHFGRYYRYITQLDFVRIAKFMAAQIRAEFTSLSHLSIVYDLWCVCVCVFLEHLFWLGPFSIHILYTQQTDRAKHVLSVFIASVNPTCQPN